ncbi:DoxX family protein [Chitinophaga horti]|uniref:DoxX family protein n=1 Tax=Chitinophaga horti TaxID=2920382 RepID=A0ABY6J8N5_9BACT|nr:DoxX family protein [Chitinophaga horti]UYQ95686.1 DoxX family protein [Chitinophaga horti]
MKKAKILYWIFNGLFAALMLGTALPDVFPGEASVAAFAIMQLPAYLLPFLAVAKILGVVAIVIPGFPRVKEWAYAGLMIDLVGAAYCIMAAGFPAVYWIGMALPLALGAAAYLSYHYKLKVREQHAGQVFEVGMV